MEAVAQTTPRRPLRRVRPPGGMVTLDLPELWAYRDLLSTLAVRDVMLRYRQTALGVIWVLIQPLLGSALLTFVFGKVAGLSKGNDLAYFVTTFAGQIFYALYSNTLTKAAGSLVGNTGLVSKVYFPRLVLPLSTIASGLIDFGIAIVVLIPLMLIAHAFPGLPLLSLPLWVAVGLLMAMGWGLITTALMVSYRDVAYVLPVVIQFLVMGSPIGWQLSLVPAYLLPVYLLLNPMAILLEGFRWSLFGHTATDFPIHWGFILYATVVAVVIFAVGLVTFRSLERRFADVI